jgi:polyhydroxyalkanoate synthase subunit PhaC
MASENSGKSSRSAGDVPGLPAPDAMLGAWSSWMDAASSSMKLWSARWEEALGDGGATWWQIGPDGGIGHPHATDGRQFADALGNDPMLRSIDQMWNANPLRDVVPVDWAEIAHALRLVWLRSLRQPVNAISAVTELNTRLLNTATEVWNDAARRWVGSAEPPAKHPGGFDKRFAAPEWVSNPMYRTLKEMYLLASEWLLRQSEADDLNEDERMRLNFHLRQFIDAMSPSLLLLSNPEAMRRAIETGGASLADGARNLMSDLKEGKLSMVDTTAFAPGRNLAMTPGKVVHRNRLIELIQYTPATGTVHKVPLLILPPWINKFYILDMQPKNSMVHFLVEQGFTVFVVSWKNPDTAMDGTTIEDYLDLGVLEASDVVREISGSPTLNVMGYCIGGTLLAMALAWLAAKGDKRFDSATFMVSLQDFSKVGDTAVFLGEPAIDFVEQQMLERGYLDSREMSNMFNLLRSNDLIWSNVVNNYLLGQKPPAFDLLYWNSDGTRMTRAAHSWYLRNTYGENNLISPGKIELKREPLDLGRITLDAYAVGAEKDHIVPWASAWRLTQLTGGKVRSFWHPAAISPGSSTRRAARANSGSMTPLNRPPRRNNGWLAVPLRTVAGGWTGRAGWRSGPGRKANPRAWAAMPIPCWATRQEVTSSKNNPTGSPGVDGAEQAREDA